MSGVRSRATKAEPKAPSRGIDMSKDASKVGMFSVQPVTGNCGQAISSEDLLDGCLYLKDRFALPKANLITSKSGSTLALGLQDRPCLRPISTAYESSKRIQNTVQETAAAAKPSGPRHDPYWAYLAAVKETEQRQGPPAIARLGVSRCQHTAYHSRVQQSPKVSEALSWSGEPSATATAATAASSLSRPITAPLAARPDSSWGWDVYSQKMCESSSPRFVARKQADEERSLAIQSAETSKAKLEKSQLEVNAGKKVAEKAKQDREVAVLQEWPHGLPVKHLTRAKKEALRVGGLGYGEVQSMPEEQYRALKSSLRLP